MPGCRATGLVAYLSWRQPSTSPHGGGRFGIAADRAASGGTRAVAGVLGSAPLRPGKPGGGERRERNDAAEQLRDLTWSPDGAVLLVQADDGDEWP